MGKREIRKRKKLIRMAVFLLLFQTNKQTKITCNNNYLQCTKGLTKQW